MNEYSLRKDDKVIGQIIFGNHTCLCIVIKESLLRPPGSGYCYTDSCNVHSIYNDIEIAEEGSRYWFFREVDPYPLLINHPRFVPYEI